MRIDRSSSDSADLSILIKQYAIDLRRNASGGDDYPWEFAKGVADYLGELIKRAKGNCTCAQAGFPDSCDNCDARSSAATATPQEFPYQQTFDAIAAATELWPSKEAASGISISVRKFQDAFNGHRDARRTVDVAQAALSRDRLAKIIEEAWRDGHSQYLHADGGLSWEEKSGVYIEALDDALTTKPPAAPVDVMEGCICQDRHRRGYCTEPGCPYSISSTEGK